MAETWYTYALIDPRTGETFYIGKGKGRRAWRHEHDVRRGKKGNAAKCDRIASIIASGVDVKVEILQQFQDEESAYLNEKERIATTERLLNANCGGAGSLSGERPVASARFAIRSIDNQLSRLIPFELWRELRRDIPESEYGQQLLLMSRLREQCRELINNRTGISVPAR